MSAASVVDLPEPVAPVTRMSPRFCMMSSLRERGSPSVCAVGKSIGISRATSPTWPRWRNTLSRNRPTPATMRATFNSRVRSNSSCSALESTSRITLSTSPASSTWSNAGTVTPSMR